MIRGKLGRLRKAESERGFTTEFAGLYCKEVIGRDKKEGCRQLGRALCVHPLLLLKIPEVIKFSPI
jgi:hypothetical protein